MKIPPMNSLLPTRHIVKVLWWGSLSAILTFVGAGCGTSSGGTRLGPAGRTVMKFREAVSDMAIAPDGTLAAVGTDDSHYGKHPVRLQTASGDSSEIVPKLGNARMEMVGFSPDGSYLAAVSQWGIWIGRLQNGAVVQHIATPMQSSGGQSFYGLRSVGRPLWQNDGTIVCISNGFFGSGPIMATWWNQSDATFIRSRSLLTSDRGDFHLSSFTLSPDGTLGAAVWTRVTRSKNKKSISYAMSGRIELIEVPSGRVRRTLEGIRPKGLRAPVISADNQWVAAADDTGRGWVWNASSGEWVQSLSGLTALNRGYTGAFSSSGFGHGATLCFLPDGRRLAAARNDGSLLLCDLKSGLPTTRVGQIPAVGQFGTPTRKLLAAPDGSKLYATVQGGSVLESGSFSSLDSD